MLNGSDDDERVMTSFAAALRLKAEQRESYVQRECGADSELVREVMTMIQGEEKMGGFLGSPIPLLEKFGRPFQIGETVGGRFEILRDLGEGGMGVVYEALDHKRQQRIAIKAAKFGIRQALTPEMESALKVRHRNVCLVNEIHTANTPRGEVDFLTMELLAGETLAAHLERVGPLPLEKAVEITRQLCAGLAEAHHAGVIHQDLKPSNVMLCRDADGGLRAVIMDFGLAGEGAHAEGLTGTPRYIAPELWVGAKASPASDLYALGVMLFEMAEGREPSREASLPQNREALAAPEPYWRLTQSCLSLDVEQRRRAFDKALQTDYWKRREWTRRQTLAVAAGLAGAVAGGLWMERSEIENLLHPLPKKRFVALLTWPNVSDAQAKPLVTAAMEAIGNQLARAEAFDKELLVLPATNGNTGNTEAERVRAACDRIGANLALALTGGSVAEAFQLAMKVIDAKTLRVLRQRNLTCGVNDIPLLASNAVETAASLLNVRLDPGGKVQLKPATRSTTAFTAFQAAEELRKKPNEVGLQAAIDEYGKAIEADSQFALAYARLAAAYLRLNQVRSESGALPLAEANAQKALQLDQALPEAHLALASFWEARGRENLAVEEYGKALTRDPDNPRILLWQGKMYAGFNRFKEAEAAYLRLKEVRPNYWPAYNDMGTLWALQGNYPEAIEAFRAATLLAPNWAMTFSNLGAMFLKVGRFTEAREQFETSLRLKPTGDAYTNLSITLLALGDNRSAVKFGRQAVELNPGNDLYWLGLADCYDAMPGMSKEAHDSYAKAAAEIERLLRMNSSDGRAWMRLALYKAKLKSSTEATALMRKSNEFKAIDVDSELVKARVLELLGQRTEALLTLAACFKQGATRFDVELTPDLAKLRKDPGYVHLLESASSGNKQPQ